MKPAIVIVGPTAVGKTDFSLEVAKQFNGEIINADSMQLYRGMNIGTAKLDPDKRQNIPHHMLDVLDVTQTANVADYQKSAPSTSNGSSPVNGIRIASVSDVAVGTAFQFTNPADGLTGYLMQPSSGTFIAYSAVCTHEGCIVDFNEGSGFSCPCHGAKFDATSGDRISGPAPRPLAKINVAVSGSDILVV